MKVLIRGAGDLATGIGWRLKRAGYEVWMTDIAVPTAVRRTVSFSRAVYEEVAEIEGIAAKYVQNYKEGVKEVSQGRIPVLVDPEACILKELKPDVLVDAIIAKRNLGTRITDAPLVIGVGPGFTAEVDCHKVIETKRGHFLGKVIDKGSAIPNTGVPGNIGGYSIERLLRAQAEGFFIPNAAIGDYVKKGEIVACVCGVPTCAQISGIIRGILQEGVFVTKGMKVGDIDARCQAEHCFTISDKARAIGGGVLEAICGWEHHY